MLRVHRLLNCGRRTSFTPDADAVPLIGESNAFKRATSLIDAVARLDATCLIEGETGTGKELFARSIHYLGPRRANPFVPLNCGAVPEALIESELFGHVKGAFTDAKNAHDGLIRCAGQGTLFLDEVDTLRPGAQIKLLRLLQEGEYRTVGSTKLLRMEARVVAACNANLRERANAGHFREDLFYRLNILRLNIPPLRTYYACLVKEEKKMLMRL